MVPYPKAKRPREAEFWRWVEWRDVVREGKEIGRNAPAAPPSCERKIVGERTGTESKEKTHPVKSSPTDSDYPFLRL